LGVIRFFCAKCIFFHLAELLIAHIR
jgi:hypothetical protein